MFKRSALFLWQQRRKLFITAILIALLYITIAPQLTGGFPDADSYYHGSIAELMIKQRGFVHNYPWLTKMIYADHFVDGHLGYHLWLIPFVGLAGLELGMHIAAVMGALLAIGALYWGLRRLSPRWALWLIWIGILTNQFMFRMTLPRAPGLAIFLLIPFMMAVVERQWRLAGLMTFIFALTYHSWPVLSVIVVVAAVAEWLTRRDQPRAKIWPLFGWHLLGLVASYVINPYFPQNVAFSWLDIFQIGLLNDRQAIRVGGEWYPTTDGAFVGAVAWPTLIIGAVLITVFLTTLFKQRELIQKPTVPRRTVLFFTLLSIIFFVLAAGAQRYFEYLIPCLLLLCAALLPIIEPFIDRLRAELVTDRPGRFVIGLVTLTLIFGPFASDAGEIKNLNNRGDVQSAATVQPALDALAAALPADSVIFHNRWDDGPTFAYAQPNLRYLIGLDPTFFANYDRAGYDTWLRLSSGQSTDVASDLARLGAQGAIIRTLSGTKAEFATITLQLAALDSCQRVYSSTDLVAFACK